MKYITSVFIFLILTNLCKAQEFDKAPLPKVKKIVEWVQIDKNKKADKGITYHFDSNGLLTQYEQNYEKVNNSTIGKFKYDSKKRLISKSIKYGYNNTITKFNYQQKHYVEDIEFKDTKYKNYYYIDKKKRVTERKSFISNYDTEYKLQLFEKTQYTFDKNDRLILEKHFNHWNVRNKNAKPDIKITKYLHIGKTALLKKIEEYDYQNQLNNTTTFEYNKKSQIVKKTLDDLNGNLEITIYKYKKGKLWTETFDEGNVVITKIYKKDRLIRKRKKWGSGKEEIIDFQYVF